MASRPAQQYRPDYVEVAGSAIVEGAYPVLGITPDARRDAGKFAFQPRVEGGYAVVVEQVQLVEDLDGAFDAQPLTAQDREQFREADLVVVGVAGQQDDLGSVDVAGEPVTPAAGFAEGACSPPRPDQRGVGQITVLAAVEMGVVTSDVEGKTKLDTAVRRTAQLASDGFGTRLSPSLFAQQLPSGVSVVVTVHSGEEQLLTPHLTEERFGGRDLACCFRFVKRLQPTQAAVPLFDRDDPPAGCALARRVEVAEGVAGSAASAGQDAPGEALGAARGRLAR
jgi:hypothetical protein